MSAAQGAVGGRKVTVDMTSGSIAKHIIMFAIPLFAGNLFQMFYNLVDTWVVGNFVNDAAFSAVGTTGTVTNLMIGFFTGFSTGSGIVISQFFGAGNNEKVRASVHTAALLTLILSAAFTVLGVLLLPLFIWMLNMPDNVAAEANTYLLIWMLGVSGLMIYNMCAAIMRAVGDSRRPFIYLVVSALINIVLDLLFVLVFGMGVAGVALATVIAQFVSATLAVIHLLRTESIVRVVPNELRLDMPLLKRIARISFPTALQMAITSISNMFVHSYINAFGEFAMGGYTAYTKIDHILILPMQSIGLAVSTFVGQNVGKEEFKRANMGAHVAFLLSLGSTLVFMAPVLLFPEFLVKIFNSNPEIVRYGSTFLTSITPFYLFWTVNQSYAGALRGSGKTFVAMLIMLFSFVVFRQIYLFIVTNFFAADILTVVSAFPIGWILSAVLSLVYFFAVGLKPKQKKNEEKAEEIPA